MQQLRSSLSLSLVGVLVLVAVTLTGCAQKSPEEKVSALRGRYSATLNGFIVQEEPVVPEVMPPLEGEEMAAEVVPESEEMAAAMDEPPAPDVIKDVMLDILFQHDSSEKLPGLTVDISMVDGQKVEKGHWRAFFETASIEKATITQRTHVLEDVDYEEGDGFFVEVRYPVPEEERADYAEFNVDGS